MNTQQIKQWIESHGFKAVIRDYAVLVAIPFTTIHGAEGYETHIITNTQEARKALGY